MEQILMADAHTISLLNAMSENITLLMRKVANLESKLQEVKGERIMNVEQCAEYLGMSVSRLRALSGEIPHSRNHRKLRFVQSEVDEWNKGQKEDTKEDIESQASLYIALKRHKQ